MKIMDVLNSKLLYALIILALATIFGMSVFFFMRARKRAKELGVPDEKIK